MNNIKYLIGSDHAGIDTKNFIIDYIKSLNFQITDIYPLSLSDKVDYPDVSYLLCNKMLELENARGILVCGSGIGMSIAANRFIHIRAALCTNSYMAEMSRRHNDANVLCLGERNTGIGLIKSILDAFLYTDFEGQRHTTRVDKLSAMRRPDGK